MPQTSPEIRFRIGRDERNQFDEVAQRLGMDAVDMMKVFIRRSIAVGGFPFEMRAPANDTPASGERFLPVHGASLGQLAKIGAQAAAAAHAGHIEAGRLPASRTE
jgi:antitoxin component of RelBE/YafQ-DinJ toxin-antitoxin module